MIHLIGGFSVIGHHINIMAALAIIMTLIFKFVYVAPFRHLCRGVEEEKWPTAAYALGTIRLLVSVNLVLGLLTVVAAVGLKGWI